MTMSNELKSLWKTVFILDIKFLGNGNGISVSSRAFIQHASTEKFNHSLTIILFNRSMDQLLKGQTIERQLTHAAQ